MGVKAKHETIKIVFKGITLDFDLATLAANAKKREGTYHLDPIHTRVGSEIAYRKLLAEMLRGLLTEVNTAILPTYTADAEEEPWYAQLAALGAALAAGAVAKMTELFYTESGWHTRQYAATVLRSVGVDVSAMLSQLDTEDLMRLYIAQNTELITNLKDDAIKTIRREIMTARIQQQQPKQLAETLRQKLNVLRTSRAELIAVDQMGKLTASLNKHRQQQSGMTMYRWNYRSWIKRDNPRKDHQAVNGKYYQWGEATGTKAGTEPGVEIRCRCFAQASIKVGGNAE